jgi:hypothetical protein
VNNLVGHPAAAAVAARLRKALDEHMVSVNDNGFLPEGADGEGYFPSRDRTIYPLQRLMLVAAAAARRERRNVGRFRTLLGSPIPALRYWAALGLLMLGEAAAPARPQLRTLLGADKIDQVRIVAAEILGRLGETDEPVKLLTALADEGQPQPIRIQALNALTYIGPAARAALPVIRTAAKRPGQFDVIKKAAQYLEAILTGPYAPRAEGLAELACREFNITARSYTG